MDMNGDYNFGLEKSHRDGLPAEWQFNTSAMGVVAANTYLSSPMVEAFAPGHWSHSTGPPNLGLGESNILSTTGAINSIPIGKPVAISSREMLLSTVPGVFPASLHHFPTDSGFIERATRFSCFSGGNFSGMNLLGPSQPMASQFQKAEFIQSSNKAGSLLPDHGSPTASPNQNLMDRSSDISNSNSESHEANFSEDGPEGNAESTDVTGSSSPSELTANKRRKTIQDTRKDQVQRSLQPSLQTTKENTEAKQKVVQVNSKHTGKNGKDDSLQTTKENTEAKQKVVQVNSKHTGKNGKDDSEVAKEGFVHVRARRGQATNSHSLAERVRREKISERMKYLQELVPGCSKVTGKAFMLDEIINYVQSLQRQVEFLSMKLAAVNPQLDFSMEGLVSKHLLHSHSGSSSAARFSQDMIYPQAYPSQQGLVLAGISSMANNSDTFRRSTNSQLQTCNFKELSLQMHNRWNEELISQIVSYGANPPPNAQEMDIKTDGFAI